MGQDQYHMAIISDQAVRANFLSKILVKSFSHISQVPVVQANKINSIKKLERPLLLLVDLMGISKTSREIILPLKKIDQEIKILALHLYRSSKLVDPLFEMGINGYMYYEPSRNELKTAIETVLSKKKYIPDYLVSG